MGIFKLIGAAIDALTGYGRETDYDDDNSYDGLGWAANYKQELAQEDAEQDADDGGNPYNYGQTYYEYYEQRDYSDAYAQLEWIPVNRGYVEKLQNGAKIGSLEISRHAEDDDWDPVDDIINAVRLPPNFFNRKRRDPNIRLVLYDEDNQENHAAVAVLDFDLNYDWVKVMPSP